MRPVPAFAALACLALAVPATAQSLAEPANAARPVNAAAWQAAMVRELPADQRFRGLPELRLGLMVDAAGGVRTCLPLPADAPQPVFAQDLCDALIATARFEPATDASGQRIDSVFVAQFAATRPTVAADYAGVPIP
ncbi:hypothetical protein [Aurantiacibacter luteus]|uniref:TonB C-terminal domain-containing protein n=1 Tax=Aurantiacibacter luteus TaxID=1581420 RepID=A0A0G9MTF2_9SPHN|nr:hypothetical protein [Aurantiacibacter luteus]KLE34047.1 hypothetical protein AAW00_07040 [Aurantiacibacter luteus]